MVKQLRALAALPGDWSSVLSIHIDVPTSRQFLIEIPFPCDSRVCQVDG